MDELLHHCLRELSFDGELGCNVSRLRDFIIEFYARNGLPQTPDDAFCAFVWSLIVRHPTVRVGIVPPGVSSEVWVAPQISAKRKAIAKGHQHVETKPPELDIVLDARSRTLDDLKEEHGDRLRIAVQPDAIYAAITGSHIRFARMSPMVYSALQIITRGRDDGISVVGLGQQSGYDQKTCFYLVRQLTDLDLVVKVRRGGVGTHFVIHKYFFDRSPSWKAIREEENRAEDPQKPLVSTTELFEDEVRQADVQALDFTPIDARHLSSLPLIRGRVVKLLKASKNYMHASQNMLITLGFPNPTKTDRRFFQSRIREMIQQGVIEKVVVPSNKKKAPSTSVKCFRLVARDQNEKVDDGIIVQPQDAEDDEKEVDQAGVKSNITIHKQVFDLLEESGTNGMTLNELSAALSQFDKRTIELLLARAEKFPPPAHLGDLGISGLMETSGRERRHRYFTIAAYHELIARESFNSSSGYSDIVLTQVGDFLPTSPDLFYDDDNALFKYQDSFKDMENVTQNTRRRPLKNPILADGSVKQGRPRKSLIVEESKPRKGGAKRKREETESEGVNPAHIPESPATKKRRNGKVPGASESIPNPEEKMLVPEVPPKTSIQKKRGRPPKKILKADDISEAREGSPLGPRKRGRVSKPDLDAGNNSTPIVCIERELGSVHQHHNATLNQSGPINSTIDKSLLLSSLEPSCPGNTPYTIVSPECLLTREHIHDNAASDVAHGGSRMPSTSTGPARQPSPAAGSIPIDPELTVDILEETRKILCASETALSGSPLTPLSEQAMSRAFSQDVAPSARECTPGTPRFEGPAQPATNKPVPKTRENRVNVSHLRRENELYRVVQNMGGIVNIQTKEFYEAHMSLLEAMAKAGEPTSAPVGTRTDKRTAVATFDNLERRGRIKQLKTSVVTHTGVRRPVCMIYLPTIGQDQLNAFLADLARNPVASHSGNFVKIDEHIEYGADPTSMARGALPLQLLQMEEPGDDTKERWSKNMARAKQLFSYEDSVVREVLLTERTTVAQLYGFIVGKAVRARELHLSTLDALEKGNPSSSIIDHERRILDLSFFSHDITLGLYCSLISSLSHSEELTQFMATESGRTTLIRDVPANLNFMLQIGRSRARSRFLDILETLRALKLVTPLQESTSDTPWISCTSADGHPRTFDVASLDGWSVSTPMAAPTFWLFNNIAPIHIWAVSEVSPPFWQDVPLTTAAEAMNFWRLLEQASLNSEAIITADFTSATGSPTAAVSVARSLRRHVSWNPSYTLTWHQMQYMKQFIDIPTTATPLQDEDGGATRLRRISWVISAPETSVRSFFAANREKLLRDMQRLQKRPKNSTEKRSNRSASTRASFAKKAAEARLQREGDWEALILRLHPTPLEGAAATRVNRVRSRFLQANSVKKIEKWEAEVAQAVQEANVVAKKAPKTLSKRLFTVRAAPVPLDMPLTVAVNPPEKSVATLIAMQGPPIVQDQEKMKRKRKNGGQDEPLVSRKKTSRRHRFQWNRDYEELARDASVIIKARCRNMPRLDWAAFEQVFPAVPRNTVRQRLAHIRETPGNEAYLTRLEDRWYDIWMQHRGTTMLPDDDPSSTNNFNLIKHVEFLRRHIDKNAIRVGFAQPKEKASSIIPLSVNELATHYEILENMPAVPPWDFVWNAAVEEGREKRMLRQPFLNTIDDHLPAGIPMSEAICLAESAVKMTLGTPHERYDPESGAALLHDLGEHHVSLATKNLLNRGVLSKLVRDPQKQKPGRQLKISEGNQNAIGGPIPKDTFQDAGALEDISLYDGAWHEWPLLATDGDSAALIQLVSQDKVEFTVNTSQAQSARVALDWNSKKADDDQIETMINVRTMSESFLQSLDGSAQSSPDPVSTLELPVGVQNGYVPGHGVSLDGGEGCCRRLSGTDIIDCTACLEEEWVSFNDSLTPEERDCARKILTIVRSGGEHGVGKAQLRAELDWTTEYLCCVLKKMTESPVALLFWTGYSSIVVVSSAFIKHWTVQVSKSPAKRISPRRWIDISGAIVVDFWESALRAVLGVIIFRPGVTQAELRWRLRSVYDRQEVGDIVTWLRREGYLKMRYDSAIEKEFVSVAALDEDEEKYVFWFVGEEKHWYQV